jgi:hypothetical protein
MAASQSSGGRVFALAALLLALVVLFFQALHVYYAPRSPVRTTSPLASAEEGAASLSKRLVDYPRTWLRLVRVDLESPGHWVTLEWEGPLAELQDCGPFHSSPGRGNGSCDCNLDSESKIPGSNCTPKGAYRVEGFNDCLPTYPGCTFATWFNVEREIAIHYGRERPLHPASLGCVRVSEDLAQTIHNNSIRGRTEVVVHGRWTAPPPVNLARVRFR